MLRISTLWSGETAASSSGIQTVIPFEDFFDDLRNLHFCNLQTKISLRANLQNDPNQINFLDTLYTFRYTFWIHYILSNTLVRYSVHF